MLCRCLRCCYSPVFLTTRSGSLRVLPVFCELNTFNLTFISTIFRDFLVIRNCSYGSDLSYKLRVPFLYHATVLSLSHTHTHTHTHTISLFLTLSVCLSLSFCKNAFKRLCALEFRMLLLKTLLYKVYWCNKLSINVIPLV